MGNCICKCGCNTHSEHLCICRTQSLSEALRDGDLKSLFLCVEDAKGTFLRRTSQLIEGSLWWQPKVLQITDQAEQVGHAVERKKVDGLIGADLFSFCGIDRRLGVQLWEADAVCECQKPVIRRGKDYFAVSSKHKNAAAQFNTPDQLRPEVHIYVVTWNMNGKVSPCDLARLLDHGKRSIDFYVIGLQEVPKFDVEALIFDAVGKAFSLVAAATMMSLRLYIFGEMSVLRFISDKKVDKVALRGLGAMVRRQKGAVAVSLKFKETALLFIASHLSPHESNVEERNSQYLRISQSLFSKSTLRSYSCLKNPSGIADDGGCLTKQISSSLLERSDIVIWLGDLNYRVEGNRGLVDFLVTQNLYKSLWPKDQLLREVQRGNIFTGYCEGPLSFRPTYKYDIGSDHYDTSPKERVPSWTDRILYKVKEGSAVKAEVYEYDSIDFIRSSDHRPVKAFLKLKGM